MAKKAKKQSKNRGGMSLRSSLRLIRKGKDLGPLLLEDIREASRQSSERLSKEKISKELRVVREQIISAYVSHRSAVRRKFMTDLIGPGQQLRLGKFRRIESRSSYAISLIRDAESALYRGKETLSSLGVTVKDLTNLREKVLEDECWQLLDELRSKPYKLLIVIHVLGRVAELVKDLSINPARIGPYANLRDIHKDFRKIIAAAVD